MSLKIDPSLLQSLQQPPPLQQKDDKFLDTVNPVITKIADLRYKLEKQEYWDYPIDEVTEVMKEFPILSHTFKKEFQRVSMTKGEEKGIITLLDVHNGHSFFNSYFSIVEFYHVVRRTCKEQDLMSPNTPQNKWSHAFNDFLMELSQPILFLGSFNPRFTQWGKLDLIGSNFVPFPTPPLFVIEKDKSD